MAKIFIRFSTPGGRGYIPGTSAYAYREDWIDLESFGFADSVASTRITNQSIHFSHVADKSSSRLRSFWHNQTEIDKVVIEVAKADGGQTLSTVYRVTLQQAFISNLVPGTASTLERELVLLSATKATAEQLAYSPATMKSAGLDPAHAIRPPALTA